MNGKDILKIKMTQNDAGASTIQDYLKCLLKNLWQDGEVFSGKRPFGNSGWEYELYLPLIQSGIVGGSVNQDGIQSFDEINANKAIFDAIDALGEEP